jgi:hypothetical protein
MSSFRKIFVPPNDSDMKNLILSKNMQKKGNISLNLSSKHMLNMDEALSPQTFKRMNSIDSVSNSTLKSAGKGDFSSPHNSSIKASFQNYEISDGYHRESTFGNNNFFSKSSLNNKSFEKEESRRDPCSKNEKQVGSIIYKARRNTSFIQPMSSGNKDRVDFIFQKNGGKYDSKNRESDQGHYNSTSMVEQLRYTESTLENALEKNSKLVSQIELLQVEKDVLETELKSSLMKVEELNDIISEHQSKLIDLSYYNGSLLQEIEEGSRVKGDFLEGENRKILENTLSKCLSYLVTLKNKDLDNMNFQPFLKYLTNAIVYGLGLLRVKVGKNAHNSALNDEFNLKEPVDALSLYARELSQKEEKIRSLLQKNDELRGKVEKEHNNKTSIENSSYYKSFENMREKLKRLSEKERFFYSLAKREFDERLHTSLADISKLERENLQLRSNIKNLEDQLRFPTKTEPNDGADSEKKIMILKKTLHKQAKIIEKLNKIRKIYEDVINRDKSIDKGRKMHKRSESDIRHSCCDNFINNREILKERMSFINDGDTKGSLYCQKNYEVDYSSVPKKEIAPFGSNKDPREILKGEINKLDEEIKFIQTTLDRELNKPSK